MFNHPGNEIKRNADFLTFIACIPSILVGIVIMIIGVYCDMPLPALIVGVLVMGNGIWYARLHGSIVYGFGVIVDKLEAWHPLMQAENMKNNSEWMCTCGHKNDADARFCSNCGKQS